MRVFVYFNLHKKVWSVKALEGERKGRVVAHLHEVVLRDAKPKVSEAGRQRVLRERKKNVHAGIVGEWLTALPRDKMYHDMTPLKYNPYKYRTFVNSVTEVEWQGSEYAMMNAQARNVVGLSEYLEG